MPEDPQKDQNIDKTIDRSNEYAINVHRCSQAANIDGRVSSSPLEYSQSLSSMVAMVKYPQRADALGYTDIIERV